MQPLQTEQQYEDALSRAYDLMQKNIVPESGEEYELEKLASLITAYEKVHYPIPPKCTQ